MEIFRKDIEQPQGGKRGQETASDGETGRSVKAFPLDKPNVGNAEK